MVPTTLIRPALAVFVSLVLAACAASTPAPPIDAVTSPSDGSKSSGGGSSSDASSDDAQSDGAAGGPADKPTVGGVAKLENGSAKVPREIVTAKLGTPYASMKLTTDDRGDDLANGMHGVTWKKPQKPAKKIAQSPVSEVHYAFANDKLIGVRVEVLGGVPCDNLREVLEANFKKPTSRVDGTTLLQLVWAGSDSNLQYTASLVPGYPASTKCTAILADISGWNASLGGS